MLALRVKLEEETDGKRRKKKFLGRKTFSEGNSVDDQISILWPKSGPRTKERSWKDGEL